MAFIMDYEVLKKLPTLDTTYHSNGEIYVESSEKLVKICDDNNFEIVKFLVSLPEHEHVIKPSELGVVLYSKDFDERKSYTNCCYRMNFLNNAKTILSLYKSSISYEDKMIYARQLFSALQFLHQYIVVGDIHSENILISDGKAYMIDLDDSRRLKEFKQIECQCYINFLRSFGNTKYTDIIKMYLECLSFILGINFSSFITKYGYDEFYKIITSYHLPKEVLEFFKVSDSNKFKKLGDEAYNIERFMTPDILELKRTLSFFDNY